MSPRLGRVALCSRCPKVSSGTASPSITQAARFSCTHRMWAVWPLLLKLSLHYCWDPNRRESPPRLMAAKTGCHHHGGPALQELTPQSRTYFSRALVPAESAPWGCLFWRRLGDAWMQSEAVHQVHWLWGLLGGSGQGHLPPVPCSRLPTAATQ